MFKIKFEGGRELEKALMEMKSSTAKAVVRRAGIKALEPVKTKAIRLAPYDPNDKDHVRDEIAISTKTTRHKKQSPVEIYAGVGKSQSKVAIQQEFGNVNHGAQPFMRPAWDSEKMNVLTSFRTEMWAEIDKAAKRAARKAAKLK